MFYNFFGLSGPPFASTDSSIPLFLGDVHREGLAALTWALQESSGFSLLVGEVGTGKTTLIHKLLAQCPVTTRIAVVSNPTLSFVEILRVITKQFGVEPAQIGKLELIEALENFVTACKAGGFVAIIVDEAQALSNETLEELRLLSNRRSGGENRLQIILVGQLELARRLQRPELKQLNQRIGARAVMRALKINEVRAYMEHRLRARGSSIYKVFKPRAIRNIARLSHGIPRRINVLSHDAMLFAFARQASRIGVLDVRRAARDYDNLLANVEPAGAAAGWGALSISAVGLVLAVACLFYFVPIANLKTTGATLRKDVAPPHGERQPLERDAIQTSAAKHYTFINSTRPSSIATLAIARPPLPAEAQQFQSPVEAGESMIGAEFQTAVPASECKGIVVAPPVRESSSSADVAAVSWSTPGSLRIPAAATSSELPGGAPHRARCGITCERQLKSNGTSTGQLDISRRPIICYWHP